MNDKAKEEFRAELAKRFGQVWDTQSMLDAFDVLGFSGGFCAVIRKCDGKRGSLDFTHMPRFYHSFSEG